MNEKIKEAKRHQQIHERFHIIKDPELSDTDKIELQKKWQKEDMERRNSEMQELEREIEYIQKQMAENKKEGDRALYAAIFLVFMFMLFMILGVVL